MACNPGMRKFVVCKLMQAKNRIEDVEQDMYRYNPYHMIYIYIYPI